ncbi:MAG: hypothetical protein WD356_07610 [Pseudomonadales bacterium]
MKQLTTTELAEYIDENEILYGRVGRPEVMLTPDGKIVKCFYPRKKLSTSTFLPQAKRFSINARKLRDRNIPAPIVDEVLYCKAIPVHLIVYSWMDGEDLRFLCSNGHIACLSDLPAFLAHLHKQGIYFRAIHLGNLLRQKDDTLAILDMSDLRTQPYRLGAFQRARNLAHLINRREDKAYFVSYGIDRFIKEYIDCCQASHQQEWLLRKRLYFGLDRDLRHLLA